MIDRDLIGHARNMLAIGHWPDRKTMVSYLDSHLEAYAEIDRLRAIIDRHEETIHELKQDMVDDY